ncbi:MAG: hypothetical protein K5649_02800 [Lachnospiraceae bacterium]|nr:hypothetical protein [Lachnospiraceae bacterium]
MNNNDLFDALSGIDPKYIDEAAHELHASGKVVDLSARRRIRKYIAIALPSAAAVLLFVGVVMSGVLNSSKSGESMAEAPMEAPAQTEATQDPDLEPQQVNREEDTKAAEATEMEEPWEIKEASYDRGILIIRCGGTIPADLEEMTYRLTRLDVPADRAKVSGGKLSKLSDKIEVTDNWIVIDMLDQEELESGRYRISIGDLYAEFEVK